MIGEWGSVAVDAEEIDERSDGEGEEGGLPENVGEERRENTFSLPGRLCAWLPKVDVDDDLVNVCGNARSY